MNRKDLIDAIAREVNITKKEITAVLKIAEAIIIEELQDGEVVELTGFGKFSTKTRAARTYRNPQTGEDVPTPSKKVPVFKFGKTVKDLIAG